MESWSYSTDSGFPASVICKKGDKEKKFVNLCSHSVQIVNSDGDVVDIPASGIVARVEKRSEIENFGGVDIYRDVYIDIYGIPDSQKDTLYIVSAPVANAVNDSRKDVVAIGKPIKTSSAKKISRGLRRKY